MKPMSTCPWFDSQAEEAGYISILTLATVLMGWGYSSCPKHVKLKR